MLLALRSPLDSLMALRGRITSFHPEALLRAARRQLARGIDAVLPPSNEWPHHVLFIAGLPKSGTTWLTGLLTSVPGYHRRPIHDPDGCVQNHDVCADVFEHLPQNRYSVVKLHTRFTESNYEVIRTFNLPTVVMYRDLRDQCVSRYFHVLHDRTHRHHELYNSISKEEGLSHSIEVVLAAYVPWISDWLPAIESEPARFMSVRYEDLRADPLATFSGVLKHFEISLPEAHIQAIVARHAAGTRFDLQRNFRRGSGTARKGTVGDWRNHFSETQRNQFEIGCGAFLRTLGYR